MVGTEEGGEEPDPADEDPQKPELILWGEKSQAVSSSSSGKTRSSQECHGGKRTGCKQVPQAGPTR